MEQCGGNPVGGSDAALAAVRKPVNRWDLRSEVKAPSTLALCRRSPRSFATRTAVLTWVALAVFGGATAVLGAPFGGMFAVLRCIIRT